jgi:[ribosomal protein S18]-alanine N-acetyltransferase
LRPVDRQRRLSRTIQIVRFRPAHLPGVLEIEGASFPAEAYPRELFLELARDCGELFFVARCCGRIAGYAVSCAGPRGGEIVSIAVHAAWRRRGVARALMTRTLRTLRHMEVRQVRLMVRPANTAAIRFYQTFGFRRVRLVRGYYEDGGDGVRMALELRPAGN